MKLINGQRRSLVYPPQYTYSDFLGWQAVILFLATLLRILLKTNAGTEWGHLHETHRGL